MASFSLTGGGFIDNIPRVLPKGCKAIIQDNSWDTPPIFDFLRTQGNVPAEEMFRTFNCGIGMAIVVNAKQADDVMMQLKALGESSYIIGNVAARKNKKAPQVEIK